MAETAPFVLLDDARDDPAAEARLYEHPAEVFVARRPADVGPVLAAAQDALQSRGGTLAGCLAYEAGLALEPRLAPLVAGRSGSAGPLVWLARFDRCETIKGADVAARLAARSDAAVRAPGIGPLDPAVGPGTYAAQVARLQRAIADGDIYQANLTFALEGGYEGDPVALYAALRPLAGAGHGALIHDGGHWLLSFSPELFVALTSGTLTARPMKGTRPRGADAAHDRALREALAGSAKDRAENLMIVDLMRNDLARIAQPGSVQVAEPFRIESFPTVHQMVTEVTAMLADGVTGLDVLKALFPSGSITGAPKMRAIELLADVESAPRGPYCGAIGRWEAGGDMAWNVAIRTLRLTPVENARGTAVLGVGSAIVADSDPMTEWRECLTKGAFVRAGGPETGVARFDLLETMRADGTGRIELLALHLQRLEASARELGAAIDLHEIRNLVQAACFRIERPSVVRLRLSRSGKVAVETRPLPAAWPEPAGCILLPLPVDPGDWRLRHKTSDRHFYDEASAAAASAGAQEALLVAPGGEVTEGAITSVFVPDGAGRLVTPPLALGLLPGVLRRSLLDSGKAREGVVRPADLANGFFVGNAVRGLVPARLQP
nr:aminodeoxychorismate synthase component I [Qipengyuania thermophila]